MSETIRFGTDGWRAVIADQFTFESLRTVADAIGVAAHSIHTPGDVDRSTLVVGYDRRFLSKDFAYEAALCLSKSGFKVLLSDAPIPSPAVSHAVARRKLLGGVVITASHNPPAYNGIKFKGWYGGSALPEMYAMIADAIGTSDRRGGGSIEEIDILSAYVDDIAGRVDAGAIRNAQLSILHDPMHGVAAGLVARVLGVSESSEDSYPRVRTVRGEINPGFGEVNPEPIEENLAVSQRIMRRGEFDVAICNDGDSDRLGVMDERGVFVSPHKILSLLTLDLIRHRGMSGDIVKTFSTTRLIETIARALGATLHETPIGFKYVADLMLEGDVLLGGEESGGIGFGSFLPERDGVLSGLLVAETVARHGRPLSVLIEEMEEEFGRLHYGRRDIRHTEEATADLIERARSGALDPLFHGAVVNREEKDGVKLNFEDGGWILFRRSGTEPMIRIYVESPDAAEVGRMLDIAAEQLHAV